MTEGAVAFLGVVRLRDQATLATCFDKSALNEEKKGFEGALTSILDRASTAYPGWREKAECRECDGVLHAFADAQALCIVVAGVRDAQYPDRVALQMLRELADKVKNSQGDEILSEAKPGALSTPLRKLMRDLMKTYNDAGSQDKTTEVRQQVDQLKGIMQDNVKRILETHVTLESLENSSSSMSSQANQFLRQSVDLRRQIQFRNLKIKLIAGACVGAVVLYVVTMFVDI
mmetsp:Transcript_10802/g.26954  ORF Transcript_10802/g.26954 Transcript_10802/m.26954 type:complete len:231 (-) Transcript_10802:155-847(-)|eukprot:CAMPEP_0115278210 /NCGR_PEP_ID=MMETSP0270-20121206/57639_1 /TAXON_ID=71861 /ORGANISM="Scrippsiella trochoidea, Strain CCMP3099" /LENGTH=230 /DNA_ID=CAMNT_0002694877 /DNA_START=135 /DNA_END=827 /DNA_ORIENTATION=+